MLGAGSSFWGGAREGMGDSPVGSAVRDHCLQHSLVPERSTPIVLSFLDLSHAGMVLGVKSQLWPWHWSLQGSWTSCANLLPVARMFPALSLLIAFARAVPLECSSSYRPVAPVFFLLISLGCHPHGPTNCWWPLPHGHPRLPQPACFPLRVCCWGSCLPPDWGVSSGTVGAPGTAGILMSSAQGVQEECG